MSNWSFKCDDPTVVSTLLQGELSQKFKVTGIPTLVFVNAESAQLITTDGRSTVMEDAEGKEFPWLPKPFSEIINGKLINNKKEEIDWDQLKGKVIGLYFSAHWVNYRVCVCVCVCVCAHVCVCACMRACALTVMSIV